MGLFSAKPDPAQSRHTVATVIGADAVFEGKLHLKHSVCIEGTFRGKLLCEGRVILNATGVLEADVAAAYLTVNGRVVGNVKATEQLDVGATGVIDGDVEAAAITVAKGGVLRGACSMADANPQEAAAPAAKARPVERPARAPARSDAEPEPVPS